MWTFVPRAAYQRLINIIQLTVSRTLNHVDTVVTAASKRLSSGLGSPFTCATVWEIPFLSFPSPVAHSPRSTVLPRPRPPLACSPPPRLPPHRKRSLLKTGSWGGRRAPPHLWKETAPSQSTTWLCCAGRCSLRSRSRPSWTEPCGWGARGLGPGRCLVPGRLPTIEVGV